MTFIIPYPFNRCSIQKSYFHSVKRITISKLFNCGIRVRLKRRAPNWGSVGKNTDQVRKHTKDETSFFLLSKRSQTSEGPG